MLRGIVSWITPGNTRSNWKANLGAAPDRPIGVEIVEGKPRTQLASRGAPGSKLCLNVVTIKQRTTSGFSPRRRLAVRSSTPGVASHSGMHGVESACYMWSHSRLSISRRRVPGPRAASASAAVSTHSRARPWPRAARTRSLTHLLACHVSDRALFPCRLRSNDPSAWRGVGLLGHEHIRFP